MISFLKGASKLIVDGHKGYYIDARISRKLVPDGWYLYEFRHADMDAINNYLCTLEPFVYVNHSGSFLTKEKIFEDPGEYIVMDNVEWSFIEEEKDEL